MIAPLEWRAPSGRSTSTITGACSLSPALHQLSTWPTSTFTLPVHRRRKQIAFRRSMDMDGRHIVQRGMIRFSEPHGMAVESKHSEPLVRVAPDPHGIAFHPARAAGPQALGLGAFGDDSDVGLERQQA